MELVLEYILIVTAILPQQDTLMEIRPTTPPTKLVDDYDFTFNSGIIMPLRVDKSLGDTIEFDKGNAVIINLKAKPSFTNPSENLPAEEVTIFTRHLLCVQHRVTEIPVLTPDQKLDWQKTFQELSKTIQ
jgi:hypothetical protein